MFFSGPFFGGAFFPNFGADSSKKKKKKRPKVIRFSDFPSLEAYQAAIQSVVAPLVKAPAPIPIPVDETQVIEDDDEEIILLALTRVLH